MARQSEQALEQQLLKQLHSLGHAPVNVNNEEALLANLKVQLEKHNKITFTDNEFKKVLNILNEGSVYDRAKTLREIKHHIIKDDGETVYFEFINKKDWCKNEFQVTNQITIDGKYENRYDVTILINGLPLVQIELKRRGYELGEAHRQILRYKEQSFGSGAALFQYVQLFVISNGVNTKYFANNHIKYLNFKQTFFWSDENNNKITNLPEFADEFLEPCHLSKMICKYIVLAESAKQLMVLRQYQYYAIEKLIDKVKNTNKNGYIWHTTGSGKTLTSFKASQILTHMPEVHKVVFVVDRRDLDSQTTAEFNNFSKGSVDGTANTKALVKQFGDDTKLLVTTIQKLNNAIGGERYASSMQALKDKKIVFIFDECHRSQFGETHKRIVKYFNNHQMFGFTGTPIFADNAVKNQLGKRTTKELFGDCLHKYVITDAIRDENVLKFSIEYVGRYKEKNSSNYRDIDVEAIDKKELFDNEDRLNKITDYIIDNHKIKTVNQQFTAMFAVSSVETLIKYYDLFKSKDHKLKIATIFSYSANEENEDADGITTFDEDMFAVEDTPKSRHSREKLDEFMNDYAKMFGTQYSTRDSQLYYNYYRDIARRVKNREIDILLVVNMFLTGFDSKPLNTLYVDKNLKHHGLIQAFSRTNRILNKNKSHGNIVSFRNLKKATDEAIALFSNKEANEIILLQPYGDYLEEFNEAMEMVKQIAPTVDSVNSLESEKEEVQFVRAFRNLMRVQNTLSSFADFSFDDLEMSEEEFYDYRSKYLDIYEKAKSNTDKEEVSALDDIDFELELMHRDVINVAYILELLSSLVGTKGESFERKKKQISDILSGDIKLRSKKELIEEFIEKNLDGIENSDEVADKFESFWGEKKIKAFNTLCEEEDLDNSQIEKIVDEYLFANQVPDIRNKVMESMKKKEGLLSRQKNTTRVIDKIMSFVNTFIEDIVSV